MDFATDHSLLNSRQYPALTTLSWEYELRRFLKATKDSAQGFPTKLMWFLLVSVLVILGIVLAPFLFLLFIYARRKNKQFLRELTQRKPALIAQLKTLSPVQLREKEAKLIPIANLVSDLFSNGEGGTRLHFRRDAHLIAITEVVIELLAEIQKAKTVDLHQKGLTTEEINAYSIHTSVLNDLWENEDK
jgi:hypothetical protein